MVQADDSLRSSDDSRKPIGALARRTVLSAAVAAALSALPVGGASADLEISELGLKIRRIIPKVNAALLASVHAEGTPGHEAACHQADALHSEYRALCEQAWRTPPRTLGDLVTRAEIAWQEAEKKLGDETQLFEGFTNDAFVRASVHVVNAALELGGRS